MATLLKEGERIDNLVLPPEMLADVKIAAARAGVSLGAWVQTAVTEKLAREIARDRRAQRARQARRARRRM